MKLLSDEQTRTPQPHDLDAEREILGAMMISDQALERGLDLLRPEDFYLDVHQKIFEAMNALFSRKKQVDRLAVKNELERRGELEAVGGLAYLNELSSMVFSPSLLEKHARIVLEKSLYRRMIEVSWETAKEALEEAVPAEELLDRVENRFLELREERIRREFEQIKDPLSKAMELVHAAMQTGEGAVTGLSTGFDDLDRYTTGLHAGELVVVAARPAMGKTSFALNIIHHMSVVRKLPTAIFSLEMPAEQLAMRLLALEARVDVQKMRQGKLDVRHDVPRLREAQKALEQAPIYIDDSGSLTLLELRTKARRAQREYGIRALFVDYLQLLHTNERRFQGNRQQEVAEISRSLKSLAKELKLPVVALSQLSRAVEQREDKRPRLSDLRESGAIEQDADLVLFLFRPEMYDPGNPDVQGLTEVIIGKQRNGPSGVHVDLYFDKATMRFAPRATQEFTGGLDDEPFPFDWP